MSSTLKLDWANHDAAKYATTHWHYSGSLPCGKLAKVGVWEGGRFIGCVIYAYGAQPHLGRMFGLKMTECVKLCRVALAAHEAPVTRIVSISLRMLKKLCPGLRAVVSYADCDHDHHGGIYAGGNWIYLGRVEQNGGTPKFRIHGKVVHGRSIGSRWGIGSQNVEWLRHFICQERPPRTTRDIQRSRPATRHETRDRELPQSTSTRGPRSCARRGSTST